MKNKKINVLVLASTFPRKTDDTVPDFVYQLALNCKEECNTIVLAPHDNKAKFKESLEGLTVYRFPYFFPLSKQVLAYRGGMVNAFNQSIFAKIQLPLFLFSQLLFSLFLIIKYNIDLIQAHWLFPQGFTASLIAQLTDIKILITTHGGDVAILKNKRIAKFLYSAVNKASLITTVSNKNKRILEESYPEKTLHHKLRSLPMGIYLPHLDKKTKYSGKTKIIFIGRLVLIKGVDFLLEALSDVYRINKNIELNILGDGPFKKEWQELTSRLGLGKVVHFRGFLTGIEKDSYLKATDIVVVPSIIDQNGYEEGLPVVALEALAFGKVLIATKTGGLPDLINQKNGILINPNNTAEITNALLSVIENKININEMKVQAIETAKQFSWDVISRKNIRYIKEIL